MELSEIIPLQHGPIGQTITRTSPGAYVVGTYAGSLLHLAVHAVGRSDDDLSAALKRRVSRPDWAFQYAYTSSAGAAYRLECRLYHEHKATLSSLSHPAKSEPAWQCPVYRM
jgi:hypothetical protein